MQKNILWLSEIEKDHVQEAGHNVFLLSQAQNQNIPVLNSFVITSSVFETVLRHNKIPQQIEHILSSNLSLDQQYKHLAQEQIHQRIDALEFPQDILNEIFHAYFSLNKNKPNNTVTKMINRFSNPDPAVTIYSKSTRMSHHVVGESNLIFAIREIWKSYLTHETLSELKNFDHILKLLPSIVVSESSPNQDRIIVEDHFIKNTSDRELTDEQIDQIQKASTKLNKHLYFPHNYEFVIKNETPHLVKISPHTGVVLQKKEEPRITFHPPLLKKEGGRQWQEMFKGTSLSHGAKIGHVKIVNKITDLHKINLGDVLVTRNLSVEFLPALTKVGAVVTESGKLHDYFHTLISKKGIPLVGKLTNATKVLHDNELIMISGKEGKLYRPV